MKTKMHSFFMMTAATVIMAVGIYFFSLPIILHSAGSRVSLSLSQNPG